MKIRVHPSIPSICDSTIGKIGFPTKTLRTSSKGGIDETIEALRVQENLEKLNAIAED